MAEAATGGYGANWINELEPTRPQGTESKSFGDDAIREIKRTLANTFPNAESGTPLSADFSQLNDLAAGNTLPKDSIIMWAGNQTALPSGPDGWTICDGRSRPGGGNAPDLRAKFVWGAKANTDNSSNGVRAGQQGGNNSTQIKQTNGNSVTFTTNGHALTQQELPSHDHPMFKNAASSDVNHPTDKMLSVFGQDGAATRYYMAIENGGNDTGVTGDRGNNQAHSHKFTIDDGGNTTSNVPRYYSALYIIKD